MSILSAFSAASSGLRASSRMIEVVSENISNALNENYAKRSVELSSTGNENGSTNVTIVGITRQINQSLLQGFRSSLPQESHHKHLTDFHESLEEVIGAANAENSLSAKISDLESKLITAETAPENGARLGAVLESAEGLIASINSISSHISTVRQKADDDINALVQKTNDTLNKIAALNKKIGDLIGEKRGYNDLMDERQALINNLSKTLAITESPGAKEGHVTLRMANGVVLVRSQKTTHLEFTGTPGILPNMSLAAGDMVGLTVAGQAISTTPDGGRLGKGALSALFQIRDSEAPSAQTQIDALARDLIERFADPAVDPTLGTEDAGLFTDNGVAFDPANELGLAGRLNINARADPQQGGALWRLREGLQEAASTNPGDATLLGAMSAALKAPRLPQSGGFATAGNFSQLSARILSDVSIKRISQEKEASFATAQTASLKTEIQKDGVNTDDELQNLLALEKTFSANARVIAAIEEMLQQILDMSR